MLRLKKKNYEFSKYASHSLKTNLLFSFIFLKKYRKLRKINEEVIKSFGDCIFLKSFSKIEKETFS